MLMILRASSATSEAVSPSMDNLNMEINDFSLEDLLEKIANEFNVPVIVSS